jgi:hypothetical protein
MSGLITPTGAPVEQTIMPEPRGMLLLVAMVCPRCQQQSAVEVRPMPLFVLQNGIVVADPTGHETEILGQTTVMMLPQAQLQCPRCSGSGLVVPSNLVVP